MCCICCVSVYFGCYWLGKIWCVLWHQLRILAFQWLQAARFYITVVYILAYTFETISTVKMIFWKYHLENLRQHEMRFTHTHTRRICSDNIHATLHSHVLYAPTQRISKRWKYNEHLACVWRSKTEIQQQQRKQTEARSKITKRDGILSLVLCMAIWATKERVRLLSVWEKRCQQSMWMRSSSVSREVCVDESAC